MLLGTIGKLIVLLVPLTYRPLFIGTSIALIIAITKPMADFWVPEAMRLGISYWSLSISLNTVLTLLIVGRLMYVRRCVQSVLGDHHSDTYTSVSAMLIESASLYSIWGLVFLICYAKNTPFQNLLLPALGQVQVGLVHW